MRKPLAAIASAGALVFAAATPAANAAPNERACANGTHGTMNAHMTVPHVAPGHDVAHAKIPHFCGEH
jgi:hypothetical protein